MSSEIAELLEQYVLLDIVRIILEYMKFAGQFLRREDLYARCITALPNGEVAFASHSLGIWSPQGERYLGPIEGHQEGYEITSILYLPSGMLALATEAGPIMFYTLKGTLVRTVRMHSDGVLALALLSNGMLASGSVDTTICVWDVDAGVCICTHVDGWPVFTLAALPENRLASASKGSTIKIWKEYSLEKSFADPESPDHIEELVTLPGGNLASGLYMGKINVWDVDAETILYRLPGHTLRRYSLLSMSDLLLAISGDNLCYVWNTKTRELVNTVEVFPYRFISGTAIVSGNTLVYVIASRNVVWME